MKTLFLVDANSLIHRAFHALPPFTAPDGRPTGALYGLASILLKVLREEKPDYVAALFDRPEPTFRDKVYKEYKAQRPPASDALVAQIIEARELFARFGIRTFEKAGLEADDLIATLVERFRSEEGLRIVVLTGDLDTLQLVENKKVVVRALKKGVSDTVIYDEPSVKQRYGLSPSQLIDYKALVGDPSDNIKGVSGIGEKSAVKLLQEFGSLEQTYRDAGKSALRGKLERGRDAAALAKELVTLDRHAELGKVALPDLRTETDYGALTRYFETLGFRTLVGRLREMLSSNKSLF